MTTAADLITVTRNRYLLGGMQEQRNKLNAAYTAGGTTLAFLYPLKGIQAGATLSVGLNTFYVWAVDAASQTATVEGGYGGSTDVSLALGTAVRVSPRYTDSEILGALNEELLALSSPANGLFQIKTYSFAYSAAQVGFDLTGVTDLRDIYSVRYTEPDSYDRTPVLEPSQYRLERNSDTAALSLKLLVGGWPGRTVTVSYRAPFTTLTDLASDVSTTGLAVTAYDLPPMGAAIRLGAGKEIRRNQNESQGDTRRAEEVPSGGVTNSFRQVMMLRQQRISDELSRLLTAYPYRT